MRPSSKSRSRNKNNNRRSVGNIINRVFDSSGPEGKVRGTPQQIIDKYLALSRDATLSGDRVAAENFAQHAEHYTRMMGEALREQQDRREEQDSQQGGGQNRPQARDEGSLREEGRDSHREGGRHEPRNDGRGEGRGEGRGDPRHETRHDPRDEMQDAPGEGGEAEAYPPQEERRAQPEGEARPARAPRAPRAPRPARAEAPEAAPAAASDSPLDQVIDLGTEGESGLVETPESKPAPRRRSAPRSRSGQASRAAE